MNSSKDNICLTLFLINSIYVMLKLYIVVAIVIEFTTTY